MSPEWQTTVARPATLSGRGIHSGIECELRLAPAPADHGVRFVRVDLPGAPEIPANLRAISREPFSRQTILRAPDDDGVGVRTVEHVLAALHGMAVDNVRVKMTGPEPPIGDGSAAEVVRELLREGTRSIQGAPRRPFTIDRPVSFTPEGSPLVRYSAWPSEFLTVTYFLEYDHPFIGSQAATFRALPETFAREIAPARTFCTVEEVDSLREKGLIRGGSVDNAIVVGRDGAINTELLWRDEFARHKILDLIGDLFLLGSPVRGHIVAYRGGHAEHAQFIQRLGKEFA